MSRLPITKMRPYTPASGAFAGRTFTTERQYRDALAQRKGYRNWYEEQRRFKKTSRRVFTELRPSERSAQGRAIDAISIMRKGDTSLTRAAREAHTTPNNVMKWAGSELIEKRHGRRIITRADRLLRSMRVVSVEGVVDIDVRGTRQASLIGRHMNAVRVLLNSGDDEPLRRFEGVKVAGVQLETDPEVIEELSRIHELSFEDIYSTTR